MRRSRNFFPRSVPDGRRPSRESAFALSLACGSWHWKSPSSGPHCSRILGDMGAEVIKIEKPGTGDLIRHWDSVVRGLSSGFVWLNGNKRSFASGYQEAGGAGSVRRLAERWM